MDILLSGYELSLFACASLILGLFLLIKSGDITVEAASFIAKKAGLSPLFIGATIIAFGTSLPELFVSSFANIQGYSGVALGNIVGSNIANIALVVAVTALILPLTNKGKDLTRDILAMLFATAGFYWLMHQGSIERSDGIIMFALLISYVCYSYFKAKKSSHANNLAEDLPETEFTSYLQASLWLLAGLAGVSIGAEFLVKGAIVGGKALGIPEAVIGLTVVAIGTSLPELATSISAARKGHADMMVGNIVGSNLFNIMSIIGITSILHPISTHSPETGLPYISSVDLWIMVGTSFAFGIWMVFFKKFSRIAGILFLLSYGAFIGWQYTSATSTATTIDTAPASIDHPTGQ